MAVWCLNRSIREGFSEDVIFQQTLIEGASQETINQAQYFRQRKQTQALWKESLAAQEQSKGQWGRNEVAEVATGQIVKVL